MKNKFGKVIFGSITNELLFLNIISFTIAVIVVTSTVSILMTDSDNTDNMTNRFNSFYVEANRTITRKDENCKDYLNKLALYYRCDAAITDLKGNIILKSKDIVYDKIDLSKIYKILQGSYDHEDIIFYQIYDMKIQNEDCKLILFRVPHRESNYGQSALYIMLIIILFIIVVTYIPGRIKAKYIKEIAGGIKIISDGNLDYKIKSKGNDELAVLADEINKMSCNLKFQIEEERKAERLKDELITNVSHDLRTPLTSLTAYLELVNSDKTSLQNKEKYAKIAEEKSHRLKNLIEDLFEYSKLESGGIKLQKNEVNIIEIIEQSIGELSINATDKNISFDKRYKDSSIILKVDSGKIARVFENIISNAVKYSKAGSIVKIDAEMKNNNVIISFESVPEVPLKKEDTQKIFGRFYRTEKSRNSQHEGSGLGLAIAKSIVKLHGGDIWAESQGEKFRISVKL